MEGEILTVEVPGAVVRAVSSGRALRAGSAVTLAIRTEYINLLPREAGGASGIPARITAKSFTGGQLRITAALTEGERNEELTASRHGIDSPLKTGDQVLAGWSAPENAIPVEDTE